jgi:hypothetical protein
MEVQNILTCSYWQERGNKWRLQFATEQDGQYEYNVTLWRVRVTIITMEREHIVPMYSLIIVGVAVAVAVAVYNIKVFVVVMEMLQLFPCHHFRATEHFVLLFTIITVKIMTPYVLLLQLSGT